jgi:glutamate-1-semialdehyde 2,1-aminomutase
MTGFRVSDGGWWKKYEAEITPDIFAFGKVIGGGFPLAAIAGTKETMSLLAPEGNVYQAGTLSGNPVATIAGLTTLQHCDSSVYKHLDKTAEQIGNGISEVLNKAGIEHALQKAGNLFSIFFGVSEVTNYSDAKNQDTEMFKQFFHAMLDQGVSLPPSAFEAWFVSAAHTDNDIEKIITAAERSLPKLK